jgi:hypothetical protein
VPPDQRLVGRFNRALKYEHLHQREIGHAAQFAEEVEGCLALHNEVRSHESLGAAHPAGAAPALSAASQTPTETVCSPVALASDESAASGTICVPALP